MPFIETFGRVSPNITMLRPGKRNIDDFQSDWSTGENGEPVSKKHSLPFRTSPVPPKRPSLGPRRSAFIILSQEPPTPVTSPRQDVWSCQDFESSHERQENFNQDLNVDLNGSASHAQVGGIDDQMDLSTSPVTHKPPMISLPPISITRSGLHEPPLSSSSTLFSPRPRFERIPTPIYPTFQRNPLSRVPSFQSTLSPALDGDTPTESFSNHPLSPVSPQDYRMEMSMSPISDRSERTPLDGLNIGGLGQPSDSDQGTNDMAPAAGGPLTRGDPLTQRTMSPRLHMGYRPDCEKCRLHVPGHYNHVVWS